MSDSVNESAFSRRFLKLSLHVAMEQTAMRILVRFKKCKQLFEYQNTLLLRDICGLYYKTFTMVIYDRNTIGQYYKTTIIDYDCS